jgi:hypothetical protein
MQEQGYVWTLSFFLGITPVGRRRSTGRVTPSAVTAAQCICRCGGTVWMMNWIVTLVGCTLNWYVFSFGYRTRTHSFAVSIVNTSLLTFSLIDCQRPSRLQLKCSCPTSVHVNHGEARCYLPRCNACVPISYMEDVLAVVGWRCWKSKYDAPYCSLRLQLQVGSLNSFTRK